MEEKKESNTGRRRLKVYYKHHDYEGGYFHPHIRIAGKFLRNFGFEVGDSIDVNVTQGQITITKVTDDPLPPPNPNA